MQIHKVLTAPNIRDYNRATAAKTAGGIGVPETRRNTSRARQEVSGFFVAEHDVRFGGPCGAFERMRRPLVRYANLHGLPPLIGVGNGRFMTYQEPIMADTKSCAGVSAQIIQHPNFSGKPIIQNRGCGRPPKKIISIRRWQYDRWRSSCEANMLMKQAEQCLLDAEMSAELSNGFRYKAAQLKQQAKLVT